MRKATLLFAILLAALDIPAQQTPTSITHFLGHAATAFFYSVDATGCTATQASLLLTNGRQVVSPGQKTNLASLFLVLQQSNICGGYSVLIASNPVAAIPASDVTFISSNSASQVIAWFSALCLSVWRISSPIGVPPGSRMVRTEWPSERRCSASREICVDLPLPSVTSNVMNKPCINKTLIR